MQDNFNLFEEYLSLCIGIDPSLPGNVYYLVSVVNDNGYAIKQYIIEDGYGLKRTKEEIITLCEVFHAKAMIDIQPRLYSDMAISMDKMLADIFEQGDFKTTFPVMEYAAESCEPVEELTVIRMDDPQDPTPIAEWIEKNMHCGCQRVKTNTGYHLIVSCLDEDKFVEEFHKAAYIENDGKTLLYYPKSKA